MKLLNKIIFGVLTSWKGNRRKAGQKGGINRIEMPPLIVVVFCIFAFFPSSSSLAQVQTNYIGNPLSTTGGNDGAPPLVILGEYNPAGPSASSPVVLPSGSVQDVKFYGQNYSFVLYALAWASNGPYAGEQTFQVVESEGFTNNSISVAGLQTNSVTNFLVNAGDFLAFCGTGPYYLQPPTSNELDATYSTNKTGYTAMAPGGRGSVFTVGTNGDTNAVYQYIPSSFTLPSRTYSIGVDVLNTNGYTFVAIAGQPQNGNADGLGTNTLFNEAEGTAVASNFDVFVADSGNNKIREITTLATNWLVTSIAGSNGFGHADGVSTNAQFYGPQGIAVSGNETVFVADTINDTIRMITRTNNNNWVVSTIAGIAETAGTNDGTNVIGRFAQFDGPEGIAVDIHTNVFVVDTTNDTVREIILTNKNWVVTTIAGIARLPGSVDGTNGESQLNNPRGIAVDNADNLYVADSANNTIRKIAFNGNVWTVSTIAGSPTNSSGGVDGTGANALFNAPGGIAVDTSGNLYVADTDNDTVRKMTQSGPNWVVNSIGGLTTNQGYVNGTGIAARFTNPKGISVNGVGDLFVDESEVSEGGSVNFYAQGQIGSGGYEIIVTALPAAAAMDQFQWAIQGLVTTEGFEYSGEGLGTHNNNNTLLFSNIPGWFEPGGSASGVIAQSQSSQVAGIQLYCTSAPPVLTISKAKGLWLSGASNATYEIDWTNNWTNEAWQNGKWPPFTSPIKLFPGSTQQVAAWMELMPGNSYTQTLFRAKWTGY